MHSDFTKRAALDKGKMCKLVMLCGREYYYRILYLSKAEKELAWYYFLSCFESGSFCGESGAHLHIVDMEIAKKPTEQEMWPISVTLNITLKKYRMMRKHRKYRSRLGARKEEQFFMPRFKLLEPVPDKWRKS